MSLINDALKRAKQSQQENPPATPPLEFRPVESGKPASRRTTLLIVGLVVVIVAILGLAGLLVWFVSQAKPAPIAVAARVVDAPLAALPTNTAPAVAKSAPEIPLPEIAPDTNAVPTTAITSEPAKPAPPKLQGIFFNPSNPSAVVSGRTVYLGDRVNGFRVMGISPVAVTLTSATETNVLSLSGQ